MFARSILFDRLKLSGASRLAETGTTMADALLAVHPSFWTAPAPVRAAADGW